MKKNDNNSVLYSLGVEFYGLDSVTLKRIRKGSVVRGFIYDEKKPGDFQWVKGFVESMYDTVGSSRFPIVKVVRVASIGERFDALEKRLAYKAGAAKRSMKALSKRLWG